MLYLPFVITFDLDYLFVGVFHELTAAFKWSETVSLSILVFVKTDEVWTDLNLSRFFPFAVDYANL